MEIAGTRIDGAIFDLDGVIVDTAKYHYLAWKELASELGFAFTRQDNELLKGVSRERSLEILLELGGVILSAEDFQKALVRKNARYVEYIDRMDASEILPGVCDFLVALRKAGIRIALGSASKNTPLILQRVGLCDAFDAVVDGNMVSRAKPDPEVFLVGARRLGVPPCNCVVFEDSQAGIDAAGRAGMRSVGIGSSDVLMNADMVVAGFSGLVLFFGLDS